MCADRPDSATDMPLAAGIDQSSWESHKMPVVLRLDGFKFMFYSNEGTPRKPVHIHVRRARDEAKFWLLPNVALAYNDGFDARTLNRV